MADPTAHPPGAHPPGAHPPRAAPHVPPASLPPIRLPPHKKKAPRRDGSGLALGIMVTGVLGLLAAFAMPLCILLVLGMIPTGVALYVDKHPRHLCALTVGSVNLAGTAPFSMKLWLGSHMRDAAAQIIANPVTWLVIYGAAAGGWLLFLGLPRLLAIFMEMSLERRRTKLLRTQVELREEWGNEVTTTEN